MRMLRGRHAAHAAGASEARRAAPRTFRGELAAPAGEAVGVLYLHRQRVVRADGDGERVAGAAEGDLGLGAGAGWGGVRARWRAGNNAARQRGAARAASQHAPRAARARVCPPCPATGVQSHRFLHRLPAQRDGGLHLASPRPRPAFSFKITRALLAKDGSKTGLVGKRTHAKLVAPLPAPLSAIWAAMAEDDTLDTVAGSADFGALLDHKRCGASRGPRDPPLAACCAL
jgi:hypothetical protein